MKRGYKVFWVPLFIIALTISIQEALPQSEDITGKKQEEVKPQIPTVRTMKYKKKKRKKEKRGQVYNFIGVLYDYNGLKPPPTGGDETSTPRKQETEAT